MEQKNETKDSIKMESREWKERKIVTRRLLLKM